MNICIVTVPSNMAYGFDGVSSGEFETFQQNVSSILGLTTLGYDKEFAPGTDCALDVWSDNDDWIMGCDGLEMEATPKNSGDTIVWLSDEFFDLQTRHDFFVDMSDETMRAIAQEFQSVINKYDKEPINA